MSIIDENDELLTLTEVAKRLPTRPHSSTIFCWTQIGVRGQKLCTVLVGGRRMVSSRSLHEFLDALNGTQAADAVTSRLRESQIDRSKKELLDDGFFVPPR